MKFLFTVSNNIIINLVNNFFNEDFNAKKAVVEYTNTEFLNSYGDNIERIVADLCLRIKEQERDNLYHLEFQTQNDDSMVIRVFQYGFCKAVESIDMTSGALKVAEFPKPFVIFIEENNNIKGPLSLTLKLPDSKEVKYTVPVMKYWEQSAQNLTKKKMYLLLPLQVFKVRKKIQYIHNSNKAGNEKSRLIREEFAKLEAIVKELALIVSGLYEDKEILGSDLEKLLVVVNNISGYLYDKYAEYTGTSKEVKIMITSLTDPVKVENAKKEGWKEAELNFLIRQMSKKFGLTKKEEELIKNCKSSEKIYIALDQILYATTKDEVLNVLR